MVEAKQNNSGVRAKNMINGGRSCTFGVHLSSGCTAGNSAWFKGSFPVVSSSYALDHIMGGLWGYEHASQKRDKLLCSMQGSSVERRVHTTSRARGHIQENTTRLCYPTTKQMIILCSHTTDPESGVALKSPVRINGVLPAKRCDASAKSHRKWVRLHADPYRRLQESKSNRFSQSKAKIKDCIKILF